MRFYSIGHSAALPYAIDFLKQFGIIFVSNAQEASHILLPVPSFAPEGNIKGGGLLPKLPADTVIIGGSLDRPELKEHPCIDLLTDPLYTAKNAMITAHCALRYAMEALPVTLEGCPVLVLGFGRIGKCLAKLLGGLGADVTIGARKASDLALAQALGYDGIPIAQIDPADYRLIYNTVPAMVLPDSGNALKIDLASRPGIGGEDVIWARGLPGKDAPESSGMLIAESIIRLVS